MKVFNMEVEMDNEAFSDDNHVAELIEIFKQVGNRLESGFSSAYIIDTNGNRVGRFSMEYESDEDEYEEE